MNIALRAQVVTVSGALSNNVFFATGVRRETRVFEASSDGVDSSILVSNVETQLSSRTTWKGGDRDYYFQMPATNGSGAVGVKDGARVDRSQIPHLDGTYNECVWLAFASHRYFNTRSNTSALPIWPTGLNPKDEGNIGTQAFYTPLPGSFFPSEVAYVTDGFEYFTGSTDGTLQQLPLLPPLDKGYTNYAGRTTVTTKGV